MMTGKLPVRSKALLPGKERDLVREMQGSQGPAVEVSY